MNRPPVTLSRTVAAFASSAGWRNVFESTAMPIHLPGTRWASAAAVVSDSSAGPAALPAGVGDVVAHPAARERGSSPASAHVSSMRGPVEARRLGRGDAEPDQPGTRVDRHRQLPVAVRAASRASERSRGAARDRALGRRRRRAPRTSPARRSCSAARAATTARGARRARRRGPRGRAPWRRRRPTIDVALLDERDRPAERGLGRHVPDHQPARAAREPAVGEQRDASRPGPAPTSAPVTLEHLLHARARRPGPRSG